jgi:hypothetical protein
VAVIFPQIEYFERRGKVLRPHPEENFVVSHNVSEAIKEIIGQGNALLPSARLIEDSVIASRDTVDCLSRSMKKYNLIRDSLRASADEERSFTLIPELRSLGARTHTDYFVIVVGKAFETPEKSKQDDMLQLDSFSLFYDHPFEYAYQWCGLKIEIALVDARSTEVVWYNYNKEKDSNYSPFEKERVKDLCRKLMNDAGG